MEDDPTDDHRWQSYHQLATARGISRASAIRLCRKHRWRRQTNNQGVVTVAVPVAFLLPDPRTPGDRHDDRPHDHPDDHPGDVTRAINTLEAAVATLREQLTASAAMVAEANVRADAAVMRADRSDAALSAERARSDELRNRLDVAQAKLSAARDSEGRARAQTDVLAKRVNEIAEAEAAQKGRGRWARLRAAWRGQ